MTRRIRSPRIAAALVVMLVARHAAAQSVAPAGAAVGPVVKYGDPVPRDVREMYDAGIRFLLATQDASASPGRAGCEQKLDRLGLGGDRLRPGVGPHEDVGGLPHHLLDAIEEHDLRLEGIAAVAKRQRAEERHVLAEERSVGPSAA